MDDYFRGDRIVGVTAPDLAKDVTYAEHIVKARGKRTRFTSVSKHPHKIQDFGDQTYKLNRPKLAEDQHGLLEHTDLMAALRLDATNGEKAARQKAVLALRYAAKRAEGLVTWKFDLHGVEQKDRITWAEKVVQPYFSKV